MRVPGANGLVTRTETCRNATITSAIRTGLIHIWIYVSFQLKSRRGCSGCATAYAVATKRGQYSLYCAGDAEITDHAAVRRNWVLTQLRRGGMTCRRGILTGRYMRARARCLSLARAHSRARACGRGVDERAARACALLVAEVPDARANQTRNRWRRLQKVQHAGQRSWVGR